MATEYSEEGSAARDWDMISRLVTEVNQRVREHISDGTFHPPSFSVLSALLHAPAHRLPMTRLAHEAAMTTGGFTRLADRLGAAGLIDRRGSDMDRRVVYAALTPTGLREARRLERRYIAALQTEVLQILDPRALRTVADVLAKLDSVVDPDGEVAPMPPPAHDRRRRAADRI